MMMMMFRVMCVLAVVLCCTCGYTMSAAAAVDNDSPSGRGVSRGAVEVSCGAGGALRVRPAAESEWLTCGAGSRVSACGKYADLCRQRTATRATTTTTIATTNAGQPKAVMAIVDINAEFYTTFSARESKSSRSTLLYNNTSYNPENEVKSTKWKAPKVASASEAPGEAPPAETTVVRTEEITPVESPRGQEGLSESAHQSNAISHASDGAASDVNLPFAETNSGHSTAAVSPAPAPTERTEPASAGDKQAANSDRSTTNAEGEANQTTPATSTTENNNSANTDSNNANSPNNEVSTTTTTTTTTLSPATAVSEGNVDASAATTTNTNTTTEAPTTTPSPVAAPNPEISTIASALQNKANVDSSVSPVWMCTAAPLLIVAVLFSATVY
ncbi:uncharacterized protein TM35_000621110 [Trypanosoma theileri]|uniref:Mucin-like glycoprotein n=1 Tax=Trypanosoma theileri TaxID=67003 RepID=A0A1X0NG46_9TRYP|nr:uncharacterized protein TM35_000621110 [Trypanosoma theileri]ORC83637.1 hypothetical protein TM35_000621110 [Trypanosoma theileri]